MDYIEYKYIIHQVEEELKKKNPCAFGIWMDYIEYTL